MQAKLTIQQNTKQANDEHHLSDISNNTGMSVTNLAILAKIYRNTMQFSKYIYRTFDAYAETPRIGRILDCLGLIPGGIIQMTKSDERWGNQKFSTIAKTGCLSHYYMTDPKPSLPI